jgi:hypothetical protein
MATAAEVLAAVRHRQFLCEEVGVERPLTAAEVLARFEASMERRADVGLLNRVANLLLESRNPFEPGRRRKPRMETAVFGTLFALVMAALLVFNLAA